MTSLGIPIGVSREGLMDVIGGWYRVDGTTKPLSSAEVAKSSDATAQTFRRQIKFLNQIGILEGDGNRHKLTPKGLEISKYACYSLWKEFKKEMRILLLNWKELIPLRELLNANKRINVTDLEKRIMMYSERAPSDKNVRMGASSLIDLLLVTNLLEMKDFIIIPSKDLATIQPLEMEDESEITGAPDLFVESSNDELLQEEEIDAPDGLIDSIIEIQTKISSMHIKNIRSISDCSFPLRKLNLLIGKNSSGKTTILYSLLGLRNLMRGENSAPASFHSFRWLQSIGVQESMVIEINGTVTIDETDHEFHFSVSFLSNQKFSSVIDYKLAKGKIYHEIMITASEDLWSELNPFDGVKSEIVEIFKKRFVNKSSSGLIMLFDDTSKPISMLQNASGLLNVQFNNQLRNMKSKDSKNILKIRNCLRQLLNDIDFTSVSRGFSSIDYAQMDNPPNQLTESSNFPSEILNKLIYQDQVEDADIVSIRKWAADFGLSDFESVLQPGRRVEGRGYIDEGQHKLPVALFGFGTNQFLTVIGKCVLSPPGGLILIEEPEIHLHPEFQARTLDFLIAMMKEGHQIILTTHSEHMIGRLQRRIAEGIIKSSDVALLWVKHESEDEGTIVELAEMNDAGILHDGLETYLNFAEAEMKATREARQRKKG